MSESDSMVNIIVEKKKGGGGKKIGDLFSPILFFLEGLENNRETIFPPPHPERTPTN